MDSSKDHLGKIIKQQRIAVSLTLRELAEISGVSPSHLGRIERNERFPSAHVLRRIAGPLGFEENELFTLAEYLSPQQAGVAEDAPVYTAGHLDPYVSRMLAQEPPELQRAVVAVLTVLKSIARSLPKEDL